MGGDDNKKHVSSDRHGGGVDLHAKGLPPASLPEFDPITSQQEELMKEFIAKREPSSHADAAQRRYASLFDNNWDIIAKKFLVSRKWNVADAAKMYNDTIDFRTKMRFHEKPIWPPAFPVRGYDIDDVRHVLGEENLRENAYKREEGDGKEEKEEKSRVVNAADTSTNGLSLSATAERHAEESRDSAAAGNTRRPFKDPLDRIHDAIGNHHPKVIHYWDKTGHPVWIEKIPAKHKEYLSAFKGALAPPQTIAEAWEEYHWHQAEVSNIITRYQNRTRSAEFGRDITSITVIMDCAHLGYGILFSDVARLSDKVWSQESKVVPESLHRIFVVNCPSIINIAFGVLKHVVPKRTQEKIVFCGKDRTGEVLRSVIDSDKLPKELGGTCECPGGCLGKLF